MARIHWLQYIVQGIENHHHEGEGDFEDCKRRMESLSTTVYPPRVWYGRPATGCNIQVSCCYKNCTWHVWVYRPSSKSRISSLERGRKGGGGWIIKFCVKQVVRSQCWCGSALMHTSTSNYRNVRCNSVKFWLVWSMLDWSLTPLPGSSPAFDSYSSWGDILSFVAPLIDSNKCFGFILIRLQTLLQVTWPWNWPWVHMRHRCSTSVYIYEDIHVHVLHHCKRVSRPNLVGEP